MPPRRQPLSDSSSREPTATSSVSMPLAFAAARGLDEEHTIAAFLHAAQLGIFELSWDVLCPTCGGVLDITT